jgi:hypothetical protein
MPRGDKTSYTDKQRRMAEHIEEGYEKSGVSEDEAEGRAWATVKGNPRRQKERLWPAHPRIVGVSRKGWPPWRRSVRLQASFEAFCLREEGGTDPKEGCGVGYPVGTKLSEICEAGNERANGALLRCQ